VKASGRATRRRAEHWFHALADETRLRILERLVRGEECVCDLTAALEAGQSRLSFHLKTLKDAGLVTDRRRGRWVYYAVRPEALEAVETYLRGLRPAPSGLRPVARIGE
jgi:ArsR family transcriptional regulator, arsenate/arsenite/antimonite-responsive transcriptional repressor